MTPTVLLWIFTIHQICKNIRLGTAMNHPVPYILKSTDKLNKSENFTLSLIFEKNITPLILFQASEFFRISCTPQKTVKNDDF